MSYKITVENKYKNGDTLKVEFDTKSALLHEASIDAEMEVYSTRMNAGLNPAERPVFSRITYKPVKDIS